MKTTKTIIFNIRYLPVCCVQKLFLCILNMVARGLGSFSYVTLLKTIASRFFPIVIKFVQKMFYYDYKSLGCSLKMVCKNSLQP